MTETDDWMVVLREGLAEAACRAIVAERSTGLCEVAVDGVCRGTADSMHHRFKRSAGGLWRPSNILHACGSGTTGCHGYIEANPTWAQGEGLWLMREDGDSTQVSVHMRWHHQKSWWLLDDAGLLQWDGGDFDPIQLRPDWRA